MNTNPAVGKGREVAQWFLSTGMLGCSVLRYGHLHAFDATGRELPARFGLVAGGLEIAVATAGAEYPILIDPLATSVNWTAESWVSFANSVSTAGDVNGDGYADVIVGVRGFTNGQIAEGAAFVYHGSASGLSHTSNWTAESNQDLAFFGSSVSTAGDIDGDGCAEFIIGNPWYDNGQTDEGRAVVYDSSPTVVKDGSFYLLPKTSGGTAVIHLD